MTTPTGRSVAFVTRDLNSYRVPFFERTRELLAGRGINFRVVVSGATTEDRAKGDHPDLGWAEELPPREFRIGRHEFWYTPIRSLAKTCDLVISEQASKQLANLPLSVLSGLGRTRHGLWGHGKNFQASFTGTAGEGIKRWFTRRADWFFAYTDASAVALDDLGYPADRITVFNNSTDIAELRRLAQEITPGDRLRIRDELGLGPGPIVGYIGGLYPPKRTQFLIDALTRVAELVPAMEAVVIGSGSESGLIDSATPARPWLHYPGAIYGGRKVEIAVQFDLLVMPGLVGLNIVDGFGLGLPTVTTDIGWHSPEISYLEAGVNGLMTDDSVDAFAQAVAELLTDRETLDRLQAGARSTADSLGIDAMATRFVDGVDEALDTPLLSWRMQRRSRRERTSRNR